MSVGRRADAEVTEGLDAVAAYAEEWERIFQSSANELSTALEWTQALMHSRFEPKGRRFLVRLHWRGRTIGFVPLFVRTSYVFRQPCIILMPLAEIANTHSDLMLSERSGDVVDAWLSALATLDIRWDCLRMSKLLEANPLTSLLDQRARARGWTCHRRYWKAAYHLALPATLDQYLAERSAKFRNHAKRAEKKLRGAGELRVVEITGPAHFESAFEALLQVERRSWKEAHGTSLNLVQGEAAFFREWGRRAAATGRLHLQLLLLDEVPIAHNLGCINRGCYFYLKTSYAAEHRPLSPATFLRLRLVENMIARGLTSIDFPGTPFEWEQQWTDTVRWQHVVSIYPNTVRGRILGSLDRWTHHWSRERQVEHGDARVQRPKVSNPSPGI